jgi:biotin carboxylase
MTAAYVSREMGLPSDPYDSLNILSRKDLFREFLKTNGFNSPKSGSFRTYDEMKKGSSDFVFPVMIKPVDSSGSKGVSFIGSAKDFRDAFSKAMERSRENLVIVEEYIQMAHECMLGGDGFVVDGRLEFCGFLNSHRDLKEHSLVPVGTSYPPFVDKHMQQRAVNEIQRLLDLLGFRMGGINIEVMFDKYDRLYIIEIGARNGGNMIPELLNMISGVDLIGASVDAAMGGPVKGLDFAFGKGFYSTYVMHSDRQGILKDIRFTDDISGNILKKVMYKDPGSQIDIFDSADKALGILFLEFGSLEELKHKMHDMYQYIDIVLD